MGGINMEYGQIVVFKLFGYEFGIDIMKVLEIQNYEPIRPVPDVPNYVEGIINVRGMIFPIFNLRKRLNMESQDNLEDTKIILMNLEKNRVGFIVDSVSEILTVDTGDLEEPPVMFEKNERNCVESILKFNDKIIIVLNVDVLISDQENIILQGVENEADCCSNSK